MVEISKIEEKIQLFSSNLHNREINHLFDKIQQLFGSYNTMNERERRALNSNSQNRATSSIARYEEYLYGGSSGTERGFENSNRSYEVQRAIDEELYYKDDEDWDELDEQEDRSPAASENKVAFSNDGLVTGDKESETVQHQSELSDEEIIASLPAVFPGIPASVATRFSARLGTRGLWRAFGQIVARRFGERAAIALGLSAGDGPLPIGEIISLGLAAATVWEVYQLWDELWAETEAELSNPNSEIIVPVEPENQIYTTPNEEQGGIEHTGGVPPQVETGTPGFDTESGVEVPTNTGGQTQVQQDASDYVLESKRRDVQGHDDEGGHTRDRHIGKSVSWLQKRAGTLPPNYEASSFNTAANANLTQARFVKQYKKEIKRWLDGKKNRPFVREIQMDREIGIVVNRNGKVWKTNKATVVLGKDSSELGYRAVTSYPNK